MRKHRIVTALPNPPLVIDRVATDTSDLDEAHHLLAMLAKGIDPATAPQGEWDELKSEEEEAIQNNSIRRAEIIDSPTCIFQKRDLAQDEITLAFQGPGSPQKGRKVKWLDNHKWSDLFDLARRQQECALREAGHGRKIGRLLIPGVAWSWNGMLRTARNKTVDVERAPKTALPILFTHQGFGWVPVEPLKTLAELKLGIFPSASRDNASGNPKEILMMRIGDVENEASYHASSNDQNARHHAKLLTNCCIELRKLLEMDLADSFEIARVARLMGRYEVELRTLADRDLLLKNINGAVGLGPQPKDLRNRMEAVCEHLRIETGKLPSVEQVRKKLGVKVCPCAPAELPTHYEVQGMRVPIATFKDTFKNTIRKLR